MRVIFGNHAGVLPVSEGFSDPTRMLLQFVYEKPYISLISTEIMFSPLSKSRAILSFPLFFDPVPYDISLISLPSDESLRFFIGLSPENPTSTVLFHEVVLVLVIPMSSIEIDTFHSLSGLSHGVSERVGEFPSVQPVPVPCFLIAAKNPLVHSGSYPSIIGLLDGI